MNTNLKNPTWIQSKSQTQMLNVWYIDLHLGPLKLLQIRALFCPSIFFPTENLMDGVQGATL